MQLPAADSGNRDIYSHIRCMIDCQKGEIQKMGNSTESVEMVLRYKPLHVESYPPVWQNRDRCFPLTFYPVRKKWKHNGYTLQFGAFQHEENLLFTTAGIAL